MAILKIADDTVQVAFNGEWSNGHKITNVCHWKYLTPGAGVDEIVQAMVIIRDKWQSEMMDIIPNNYTFQSLSWLDINSEDGASGTLAPNTGLPSAGAKSQEATPPNCAVLVRKLVEASGRGAKNGRMYIPTYVEAEVTENGVLSSVGLADVQASVTAFFNAVDGVPTTGNVFEFSLPHFLKRDHPGDVEDGIWPADSVSTVTALQVQSAMATQRRRLR